MMREYRTDLAMERTATGGHLAGVRVEARQDHGMETTLVHIDTSQAAAQLGKACGSYWTLTHPMLASLSPEERMPIASAIAAHLQTLVPKTGDVLVLGLGNRRFTADALGDRVVSGILVTRHIREQRLRSVCAMAPGVLGVTGMETAELAAALVERLQPSCVLAVDALAAMETRHMCTTVQVTDTGIRPGSGVGNHRKGIDQDSLHVPVIAIGVPMVVYTSTIVRDALTDIFKQDSASQDPDAMAEELARTTEEMIVTTRDVDSVVQGLADLLALAINKALQPQCSLEELSLYLH